MVLPPETSIWCPIVILKCVLLCIVSQPDSTPLTPGNLDVTNMTAKLLSSLDRATGYSEFQEYLSTNAIVEEIKLDGKEILTDIQNELAKQLNGNLELAQEMGQLLEIFVPFDDVPSSGETRCGTGSFSDSQFDFHFRTNVDKSRICYSVSSTTDRKLFPRARLLNYVLASYGGSIMVNYRSFFAEDGAVYTHPANENDYGNYDPRVRPFYAHAVNRHYRDVLLVLDTSKSLTQRSIDGETYAEAIVQAADLVVKTLHSKDRLAVVTFPKELPCNTFWRTGNCCPFNEFQSPTDSVRNFADVFRTALKQYGGTATVDDRTNYAEALKKALFKIHDSQLRHKIIMVIAGTNVDDLSGSVSVLKEFKSNLKSSSNPPTVTFHQIGSDTIMHDHLVQLRAAYVSGYSTVMQHTSLNDLKRTALFYRYFQPFNKKPRISNPYVDFFRGRPLVTITMPVFKPRTEELRGVLGLDMWLSDYFLHAKMDPNVGYTFVFDRDNNNTLYHHLLPSIQDENPPVSFFDIRLLEGGPNPSSEFLETLRKLLNGQTVSAKLTREIHYTLQGLPIIDGSNPTTLELEYVCSPIDIGGNSWETCCVLRNGGRDFRIKELPGSISNRTNLFHDFRQQGIMDEFPAACRHFYAAEELGIVRIMLSASCFSEPMEYIYIEDSPERLQLFNDILLGTTNNTALRSAVVDEIRLADYLEHLWLSENYTFEVTNGQAFTRRLLATRHNVLLKHPAVLYSFNRLFEFSVFPFYVNAMHDDAETTVDIPYLDPTGHGYVVQIGRRLAINNTVFGLIGATFRLEFLQELIRDTVDLCTANGTSCILVDNNGMIVSHPLWVYAKWEETIKVRHVSIFDFEPEVGSLMLSRGVLKLVSCYNIFTMEEEIHFRLELDTIVLLDGFAIQPVTGTNIFLIAKFDLEQIRMSALDCLCADRRCSLKEYMCTCPCVSPPTFSQCQQAFVNPYEGLLCHPVPKMLPKFYLETVTNATNPNVFSYEDRQFCTLAECAAKSSRAECHASIYCRWCTHTPQGRLLVQPFCGDYHACWFGQIDHKPLYPEFATPRVEISELKANNDTAYVFGGIMAGIVAVIVLSIVIRTIYEHRFEQGSYAIGNIDAANDIARKGFYEQHIGTTISELQHRSSVHLPKTDHSVVSLPRIEVEPADSI